MTPASRTTHRLLVTVCVILAMFMAAIEVTIVATAMPAIVGQLGNFSLYTWVFSAFLLTQAATIMMFGKLADLYGRRPVLIAGISVFLLGSVLCGLARSMMMLIIFRLIQGLGAGSIQPVAMTIIGDLYTLDERAKIQGYLASVWGVAAIIGPLAGGFIVQVISWPWVFWINVPIGLITVAGVLLFLHENVEHRQRRIDYLGSLLFGGAVAAFLLVLTQGGTQWPWASMEMIALAATFVGCLVLLLLHERRMPEPMIALDMWTSNHLIASANSTVLVAGMMLIGITSFLPMYVQGVMGRSAIVAGFTLTIMSIGWPLGSALSSRFFGRTRHRWNGALRRHSARDRRCVLSVLDAAREPRTGGGWIVRNGVRDGPDQHDLHRANSGQRGMVEARQRHRLECLRAHSRQHAGGGGARWPTQYQPAIVLQSVGRRI